MFREDKVMDLSLCLPNRSTPSYKVRRSVRPRKTSKVWDFSSITGNAKDKYVIRECGKAAKRVEQWSYHKGNK
jgi:hypothetical protein